MAWTEEQYREYLNKTSRGRKSAKPEQDPVHEPLVKAQDQEGYSGKIKILYTNVCKRLLDPDNNFTKYHTDALRYAHLIQDDTSRDVEITTSARRCDKNEKPHTLIEIIYP